MSDNTHEGHRGATGSADDDKLPIRMLHDRVLVRNDASEGERRSGGGILIPATTAVGGAWPGPSSSR